MILGFALHPQPGYNDIVIADLIWLRGNVMTQAVAQIVESIRRLSPGDKRDLFDAILQSGILTEDQQDILIAESRKNDPTVPADKVFEDLRQDGKL